MPYKKYLSLALELSQAVRAMQKRFLCIALSTWNGFGGETKGPLTWHIEAPAKLLLNAIVSEEDVLPLTGSN